MLIVLTYEEEESAEWYTYHTGLKFSTMKPKFCTHKKNGEKFIIGVIKINVEIVLHFSTIFPYA